MTLLLIDTSVAVPLLLRAHPHHEAVLTWAGERDLALAGHAEVETFSVLTRLPDPFSIDGASAVRALTEGLGPAVHPRDPGSTVRRLTAAGVSGGAVYDGLVAIAAKDAGAGLASRDARALPTYARLGVRVEIVP